MTKSKNAKPSTKGPPNPGAYTSIASIERRMRGIGVTRLELNATVPYRFWDDDEWNKGGLSAITLKDDDLDGVDSVDGPESELHVGLDALSRDALREVAKNIVWPKSK